MKSLYRKVDSFDGQTITIDGKPSFELGSFLGGGAAGVVYEGVDVSGGSHFRPVAIKVLNPVGFRLAPAGILRRCVVARRGQPVIGTGGSGGSGGGIGSGTGIAGGGGGARTDGSGGTGSSPSSISAGAGLPTAGGGGGGSGAGKSGAGASRPGKLGPEHVWWLVSPNTKQVLAAYIDPRYGSLLEIPLPKCIEIWGLNPRTDAPSSPVSTFTPPTCRSPNANADNVFSRDCWSDTAAEGGGFDLDECAESSSSGGSGRGSGRGSGAFEVQVDGMGVSIPWLPPKYVQWLSQRRKVKREINNMGRVAGHRNVLQLLSVLELIQDSKSTLFLILELVTGGELLDHIRLAGEEGRRVAAGGHGAKAASALGTEGAAQRYFSQLLSGLAYCHRRGVCHRDLSPSNLLLAESPQGDAPPVLKVADFGLSACCGGSSAAGNENSDTRTTKDHRGVPQRVRSVVGSPYYMAPEVSTRNTKGYDGFKADAWSCGVVLYTMLTQTLPFDRDLSRCARYKRFKTWAEKHAIGSGRRSSEKPTHLQAVPPRRPSGSSTASPLASLSPPAPLPSSPSPLSPSSSSGLSGGTRRSEASLPSSPLRQPISAGTAATATAAAAGAPQSTSGGRPPASVSPPSPPVWLFPPMIPPGARALLVALLVPNPSRRMSVEEALSHPWLSGAVCGSGGSAPDGIAPGGRGQGSMTTAASAKAGSGVGGGGGGGGSGIGSGNGSTDSYMQNATASRELAAGGEGNDQQPQQQQQQQQQQPQQKQQEQQGNCADDGDGGGSGRGGVAAATALGGQVGPRLEDDRNEARVGGGRGGRGNGQKGAAAAANRKANAWRRLAANTNEWSSPIPSTTSFP